MITINNLRPFYLSSELKELQIETDQESIEAVITISHGPQILREEYFPYNGKCVIYELDTLIEEEMRSIGAPFVSLSVKVSAGSESQSASADVLFCSNSAVCQGDTNKWVEENFLTSCCYRRIRRGQKMVAFAFIRPQSPAVKWEVRAKGVQLSTGERLLKVIDKSQDLGAIEPQVVKMDADISEIYDLIESDEGISHDDFRIDSVVITSGRRFISFYIDDEITEADPGFLFISSFNLPDYISLPGQITSVTSPSAETASLLGRVQQYDRKLEKTFKVSWPVITTDEIPLIEDFICSHAIESIIRTADGANSDFTRPVIITESKLETKSFDELNAAEFTYRFTDSRNQIYMLYSPGSIFTAPYNLFFA